MSEYFKWETKERGRLLWTRIRTQLVCGKLCLKRSLKGNLSLVKAQSLSRKNNPLEKTLERVSPNRLWTQGGSSSAGHGQHEAPEESDATDHQAGGEWVKVMAKKPKVQTPLMIGHSKADLFKCFGKMEEQLSDSSSNGSGKTVAGSAAGVSAEAVGLVLPVEPIPCPQVTPMVSDAPTPNDADLSPTGINEFLASPLAADVDEEMVDYETDPEEDGCQDYMEAFTNELFENVLEGFPTSVEVLLPGSSNSLAPTKISQSDAAFSPSVVRQM